MWDEGPDKGGNLDEDGIVDNLAGYSGGIEEGDLSEMGRFHQDEAHPAVLVPPPPENEEGAPSDSPDRPCTHSPSQHRRPLP